MRHVRVSPDGKRLAILEPSRGENEVAIIDGRKQPVTIARGWARRRERPGLVARRKADLGLRHVDSGAAGALRGRCRNRRRCAWSPASTGSMQRVRHLTARRSAAVQRQLARGAGLEDARSVGTTAAATTTAEILRRRPFHRKRTRRGWTGRSLADLSPDGRTILFSETREGGGARERASISAAPATPAPMHIGDGIGDALSPDGKWALVPSAARSSCSCRPARAKPRELSIDGAFDNGAAWLPDSRRAIVAGVIARSRPIGSVVIDTLDETAKPISPEKHLGRRRARLRRLPRRPLRGRHGRGQQTIALYRSTGTSRASRWPAPRKARSRSQWSADGASLFVHDPTALPARVCRINLATGTREPWKEFMPADPAGIYRIAPVLITPTADAYAYNAHARVVGAVRCGGVEVGTGFVDLVHK